MVDEEIDEIRAIRHAISAEHGHDVQKVLAYYRACDEELRKSGRYRYVTPMSPKKSLEPPEVKPAVER